MMKTAIVAGLIGLGITSAVSGAPASNATPGSYLATLRSSGFYSTAGTTGLLNWGYRVCNDEYQGYGPAYSASNISNQTSLTYSDALELVYAARIHLC
jgi:Protein of unknown function (DUF732)